MIINKERKRVYPNEDQDTQTENLYTSNSIGIHPRLLSFPQKQGSNQSNANNMHHAVIKMVKGKEALDNQ